MNWLLRNAYRLYRLHWWVTRPLMIGVRLILVQDGEVLLVKHTYQRHWYFPGGLVQRGETLAAAVQREAKEEAGVTLLAEPKLLGMYTNFLEGKSDHIAVFVATAYTQGPRTDRWEIADCRTFPLTALPADLSPACRRRLADYQRGAGPYVAKW